MPKNRTSIAKPMMPTFLFRFLWCPKQPKLSCLQTEGSQTRLIFTPFHTDPISSISLCLPSESERPIRVSLGCPSSMPSSRKSRKRNPIIDSVIFYDNIRLNGNRVLPNARRQDACDRVLGRLATQAGSKGHLNHAGGRNAQSRSSGLPAKTGKHRRSLGSESQFRRKHFPPSGVVEYRWEIDACAWIHQENSGDTRKGNRHNRDTKTRI